MNNQTHVVLLGAGAIGVLPAALLVRNPAVKLSVAADADRVARYREEGIFISRREIEAVDFDLEKLLKDNQ